MRARNIKPGFFRNELLVELDYGTRLLFVGLWLMADREGRLEDRPKRMKMELFPADDMDVEAGLAALASAGFVVRYEVAGVRFLEVVNFARHQSPHHREPASVIPPPQAGLGPASGGQQEEPDQRPQAGLGPALGEQQEEPDQRPQAGLGPALGSPAFGRFDSLIPDSLIPDSLSPTRRGALAKACKAAGVRGATSQSVYVVAWERAGLTDDKLAEAIERAREYKPRPTPIPAAYLATIVAELVAAPARPRATRAWWASEEATIKRARELGVGEARNGESWEQYRERIRAAEARESSGGRS